MTDVAFSRSAFLPGLLGLALLLACSMQSRAGSLGAGESIPIGEKLCSDMRLRRVLNQGAVVGCDRLRLVKFSYFGFDGQQHNDGEIIVLDAVADHVLQIFAELRKLSFPIAKARLMNNYDGNDNASMADNNTSSFNVRKITGGGAASLHAYGLAIDLNPVQNPYAKRSGATFIFSPGSGAEYANRRTDRPGKAPRAGMAESVIDIFADNGFLVWGGYWDDPIDYQHFEVGRNLAEKLVRLAPADARELFARHVASYRTCRAARREGDRSICKSGSSSED